MNNFAKKLAIALLISIPGYAQALINSGSFYMPHAQTGVMPNLMGLTDKTHVYDNDEMAFVLSAQTSYGQSMHGDKFAGYFTPNGTASVVFGPRNASGTHANVDVFGLNFNLESASFKSTVTFDPKVTNWSTNFGLFADLANWVEGLYVKAHLPLQYIKNDLQLSEVSTTASAAAFTNDAVNNGTPSVVYTTAVAALKGDKTVGDVLQVRKYGKVDGARHATKLSDATVALGYDFVRSENGHFGVSVGGLFGLGGKPKAEYMFEPVFGNAGRHGVFGAVDGHASLWSSDDDKELTVHLDGKAGYIFANSQLRSYDLTASGKWSRYLAVRKIGTIGAADNTYYGGIDNMINVGTLHAKIGDYVNYDANLLFNFQYNNFDFQLGYTFAGHSKEKHKSFVDDFSGTYIISDPNNAINVSSGAKDTDSTAVSGSTFTPISGNVTGVPTAVEVVTGTTTALIAESWLDKDSVLSPSTMSHAVVGGLNYTWRDNDWLPSLGLIGKVEFNGSHQEGATAHNTPDLYMVGVQGNVSF